MKNLLFLVLVFSFINVGCGHYYDYVTEDGIMVYGGDVNNPTKIEVESWTQSAMDFWKELYPDWDSCMIEHTSEISVYFSDWLYELPTEDGNVKVAGMTILDWNQVLISNQNLISNDDKGLYVRAVYIHEMSHVYVGHCGGMYTDQVSHQFFADMNLRSIYNL